jgi:hypothetical protein
MNMIKPESYPYYVRIKVAVIVMLMMTIVLFKFWPQQDFVKIIDMDFIEDQPMIMLDPTVVTIQKKSIAKPPPSGNSRSVMDPEPVSYPNAVPTPPKPSGPTGNADAMGQSSQQNSVAEPRISNKPTRLPSVVRIVEPVVPEAVKINRIKAELTVRVLVGVDGSVEKAEILEIRSLNTKTGQFEKVNDIAFGIKEATLQAAMGWKFRPALEGSEKVKFWSKHLFTFGS